MNKFVIALIAGCITLTMTACGRAGVTRHTQQQKNPKESSQERHVDEFVIRGAHVEADDIDKAAGTQRVVFTIKNTSRKMRLLEGVLYQNVFSDNPTPQEITDSNGRGTGNVTIGPGESIEAFIRMEEGLHVDKVKLLGYRYKIEKQLIDGSFSTPVVVELTWD